MRHNKFYIRKKTDSSVYVFDGQKLFAGSVYEVSVDADEFREDTTSPAVLGLFVGGIAVASCPLAPDVQRRGLRTGTLAIPVYRDTVRVDLRVTLAGDTLFAVGVPVVGAGVGEEPGSGSSSSRWTVADLGAVASGVVSLADMTQVRLAAPVMDEPLAIVPPQGPLDAFVVVEAAGGTPTRFPFTDVLVGGAHPVWSHKDSFAATSRRWMLRVLKVVDDYYADLRIGRPPGVELDPDGAVVESVEVNS